MMVQYAVFVMNLIKNQYSKLTKSWSWHILNKHFFFFHFVPCGFWMSIYVSNLLIKVHKTLSSSNIIQNHWVQGQMFQRVLLSTYKWIWINSIDCGILYNNRGLQHTDTSLLLFKGPQPKWNFVYLLIFVFQIPSTLAISSDNFLLLLTRFIKYKWLKWVKFRFWFSFYGCKRLKESLKTTIFRYFSFLGFKLIVYPFKG